MNQLRLPVTVCRPAGLLARFVTVSAVLWAAAAPLRAQDDVSSGLESIRSDHHLPGMSAMAIQGGQIVAEGSVGVLHQEYLAELTTDHQINIGSCSKWFTAVLTARLVDSREITWEMPICDLLPEDSSIHPDFQNATIEDFLSHRSGVQQSTTFLARHWDDVALQTGTTTEVRLWLVLKILSDEPEVPPGEFLYANQGYAVVAAMLEAATGRTYGELLEEWVFRPLRMSSAKLGIAYDRATPPTTAVGHGLALGGTTPVAWRPPDSVTYRTQRVAYEPAGFVSCTMGDWAKFLHTMMIEDDDGFLSADSRQRLQQPYAAGGQYGFGIYVTNRAWADPGPALNHSGEYWGHSTLLWAAPAHDFITIAFTNCDTADNSAFVALDQAVGKLIGDYLGRPVSGPWLERPEIVRTSHGGGGTFEFEYTTLPGVAYRVEAAPDGVSWEPVNGENGEVSHRQTARWVDDISPPTQLFRVLPVQPSTGSPGP